jgi:hypothetical protein
VEIAPSSFFQRRDEVVSLSLFQGWLDDTELCREHFVEIWVIRDVIANVKDGIFLGRRHDVL